MRFQQSGGTAGSGVPGPSFSEVLVASTFVKPYWAQLYAMRQELHRLKRRAGDHWLPVAARIDVSPELAVLEQQATSLLSAFEASAPNGDPTGKIGLLREAIRGFLYSYAERHRPRGGGISPH